MKGNPFFGTMRGKLGEQVFSRTGGEQRARMYLKVIANPRTKSQMGQRVKLSNLVNGYRVMRPVLGDSFLNRPANQSSYNAFVRANLSSNQVYLTKEQAASGLFVPDAYKVTSGNLLESQVRIAANVSAGDKFAFPFEIRGTMTTEMQKSFHDAYMAYYPDASEDDVLLFMMLVDNGGIAPFVRVERVYLSQLGKPNDFLTSYLTKFKPAEDTYGTAYIQFGETSSDKLFNKVTMAVIRARMNGNKMIVCSSESLLVGSSDQLKRAKYTSELAKQAAINSYGYTTGFAIQQAVRESPEKETEGEVSSVSDGQ